MTSFGVLDARAESACRLINLTMGLHRTQMSRRGTVMPASRLIGPDFDSFQVQRQGTLLRMLSITESFCVDRLLERAEIEVEPEGSSVRAQMWDRASTGAVSNWEGIRNSYKAWYDVRPRWTDIDRLIEVRNAVAHGLGQLTRTQRLKLASTLAKITSAGVRVDAELIILEEANLEHARVVCLDLIEDIDMRVQALGS